MTRPAKSRRDRPHGEQGYILLAVVFLTVMVLIALSVAAPNMARSIQRDREMELMHRGKQFQRAIQLYYRKFGAYPPTMDALEKTNNIRFLRKRYKDPITGKDEWHLIHFGEAKTQTLGFFGQPLAGTGSAGASVMAGIGPSGGNQNTTGPLFGGSSLTGTEQPTDTVVPVGGPADGTQPNSGAIGTAGATSGATSGSSFGTSSGTGQTFGGGGIIGVESTSTRLAILEFKKKKHYNEWEFVFDPLSERFTLSNNMGTSATGSSNPTSSNGSSPFGNSIGSGSNSGSGFGSGSGTPPPQPQQ